MIAGAALKAGLNMAGQRLQEIFGVLGAPEGTALQADLTGTFKRPFPEQVAFFRGKLGNLVPTRTWRDLEREAHDSAFMVAGAMKADLLADLAAAVDKAVTQGRTLDAFRRDFRSIVERNGWHGWTGEGSAKGEAWRTRVVYATNMRTAYAGGRYAQLQEFPVWVYRHGGSNHPRLDHLAWDGLMLPREHAFWERHYPPNGWGCSCYVTGAAGQRTALRVGGNPDKKLPDGWDRIDPRTGTPPGIGKGWDYAPGRSRAAEISALAGKVRHWDYQVAKAYMQEVPPARRDAFATSYRSLPSTATDVRNYAERALGERGGGAVTNVEVQPSWTLGLATSRDVNAVQRLKAIDAALFDFSLDPAGVRHVMRSHGDAGREEARGQRAVTAADFALLPRIINAPDAVEDAGQSGIGAPLVRYVRRIGSETFTAVFAVRTGRRTLALQSLWVR